jgi:Domain of unknown function (DU1801)
MSELKTKPSMQPVLSFISDIADAQRRADCLELIDLMQAVTGHEAVMWGAAIVGFGKYQYHYESGRTGEWMLIGFSPRKNDLSLYLMSGVESHQALLDKLGKYKTGKSCLYLKRLADVDKTVLKKLMAASVKVMAKQYDQ